jgi:hypothetical protein
LFDEFQEVVAIDPRFPNLMRATFQAQPEVGHVYLGSKRHVLEGIFNDRNQPFWRSAKRIEIGVIDPRKFADFIRARFTEGGRELSDEALERLLDATGGHPYATQELAYYTWELVPPGAEATTAIIEQALTNVLRSENNHLAQLWDDAPKQQRLVMLALAEEPTDSMYSAAYRERHELPSNPSLQTALGALSQKEIVGRDAAGRYALVEPFVAEWLMREQRQSGVSDRLRG